MDSHLTRNVNNQAPSNNIANDPILAKLYRRTQFNDQNNLGAFIGATGSGKTGCAITTSIMLDVDAQGYTRWYRESNLGEIDLNKMYFSAIEFAKSVDSGYPKGSCFVWDEAGIDNDNTQFMSAKQRFIKYIMQTFRYKNYSTFFTVPDLESIALSTRRLLHIAFSIYPSGYGTFDRNNYRLAKVVWNRRGGINAEQKWYRDVYLDGDERNQFAKITNYIIPKPPQNVFDKYQEMKNKFTKDLYENIRNDMNFIYKELGMLPEGEKKDAYDINSGMKHVLEHITEFTNPKSGKVNVDLVAFELGLPEGQARRVTNVINTKIAQGKVSLDKEELGDKLAKLDEPGYLNKQLFE
jgi:hypothetical protein